MTRQPAGTGPYPHFKPSFTVLTPNFRLIKGDGEVIEEIVSRDRHKAINQQATTGDGNYFQTQTLKK